MRITTERMIVHSLLNDPEFFRTAAQHLRPDFFEEPDARTVYEISELYFGEYNEPPSKTEIKIALSGKDINPEAYQNAIEVIEFQPDDEIKTDWILGVAEEYCKRRAVTLALVDCLAIAEGRMKNTPLSAVNDLMEKATNFSFDNDIGLDFWNDVDRKAASYDENVVKIPSKLGFINKITSGGYERKTVNCVAAPTGFGKSIFLGDEAVFQSKQGLNVVYITFEMSDERIAKRMDATANDRTIEELRRMIADERLDMFKAMRNKKHGYLILKEFGPGEVTAAKIRLYLKQVEITMGEKADVVCIDYLNLMASSRFRADNTYMLLKGICEELVGLAKKEDICILTATQFNRGGQKNTSPEIKDISESQAVANTVDFLLALYDTDEFAKANKAVGKQLKNRYGDKNYYNTFVIGIERGKMAFHDVSEEESNRLTENVETPAVIDINNNVNKFKKGEKVETFDFDFGS